MKSRAQFRAQGPPALSSAEYAADYNEAKSVGAFNSTERTPDQTEVALFWMPNIQIMFNNIARIAAAAHHNGLSENARLFALLNLVGFAAIRMAVKTCQPSSKLASSITVI